MGYLLGAISYVLCDISHLIIFHLDISDQLLAIRFCSIDLDVTNGHLVIFN